MMHGPINIRLKLDIPSLLIFPENYSITHYDEKHCHWISIQATLHSSVASYSQNEMTLHKSVVGTSGCLKHNTAAVHMLQSNLCSFLFCRFTDWIKVNCFSNGTAAG